MSPVSIHSGGGGRGIFRGLVKINFIVAFYVFLNFDSREKVKKKKLSRFFFYTDLRLLDCGEPANKNCKLI